MRPVIPSLVLLLSFGLACSGFGPSVSIDEHFGRVCPLSKVPPIPPDLDLVTLEGPPLELPDEATVIEVRPGEVRLYGSPVPDLTVLEERLPTRSDGAALLLVDAEVQAAQLVEVLGALHRARANRPALLARSPTVPEVPPYPDPAFADELLAELAGARDPAERAALLATRLESEIRLCPGAMEAFGAVAMVPPELRCKMLAMGMKESLPSCVFTDGDRVLTAFQVAVLAGDPLLPTGISLDLDLAAAEPLAVPATTTWKELLPTLAQRQPTPGWITVAGSP